MSILNLNKKVLLSIICFLLFTATVIPCAIIAANSNLKNTSNIAAVSIFGVLSALFGIGLFIFSLIHFIEKKQRNNLTSAYSTVPTY